MFVLGILSVDFETEFEILIFFFFSRGDFALKGLYSRFRLLSYSSSIKTESTRASRASSGRAMGITGVRHDRTSRLYRVMRATFGSIV